MSDTKESTRERFARNSQVYIVQSRDAVKGRPGKVIGTYDFHEAVKVSTSSGEEIVTPDQILTSVEIQNNKVAAVERKAAAKREAKEIKLAKRIARLTPIVEMLKAGKNEVQIAAELGINLLTVWSRKSEAKKAGML